jgi:predicted lipid carrier protein YhbT
MFVFKQLPTQTIELKEQNWEQEAYIEGFLIENLRIFERREDNEAKFLGRQISISKK